MIVGRLFPVADASDEHTETGCVCCDIVGDVGGRNFCRDVLCSFFEEVVVVAAVATGDGLFVAPVVLPMCSAMVLTPAPLPEAADVDADAPLLLGWRLLGRTRCDDFGGAPDARALGLEISVTLVSTDGTLAASSCASWWVDSTDAEVTDPRLDDPLCVRRTRRLCEEMVGRTLLLPTDAVEDWDVTDVDATVGSVMSLTFCADADFWRLRTRNAPAEASALAIM
mmetsp:Transcript_8101/g.23290  ORF Transcript_8101/g.23290 Transcript_8101/m.23290 type:complete len:225 (+) Transcript_8101:123-797(+)